MEDTQLPEEPTAAPPADPIRGQLHLELTDVRSALFELQLKAVGVYGALIGSACVVFVVVTLAQSEWDGSEFVWLLLIVLIPWAQFSAVRRVANTVMENKSESERNLTYEFAADGYAITTPASSTRADWTSVHRTKETSSAFFIFPSENIHLLIPKRALADGDVARAIRSHPHEHE